MLTASLNDRMPGWLTIDNFWWCVLILSAIAAVCGLALYAGREKPTDWAAPATDTPDPDNHACEIPAPPVVWSTAIKPGRWVCGVTVDDLPGEICGWPVTTELDCPAHGTRVRGTQ